MDRIEMYFKMEVIIAKANDTAEAARWQMAKLVYEQRQETSIAECAALFGKGKHHIIYMTNAWDRRSLKPANMTFSVFYNSQLVRGMDPRKRGNSQG